MDKAREAVQRPAESLLGALQAAEVSWDDADELRDYLLLKGEISRHKQDPHGYKPPKGAISTMDAEMATRKGATRWPLINALRSGAHSVVEAAYEYRMGPEVLAKPNGHETAGAGSRLWLIGCIRALSSPSARASVPTLRR